MLAVPPNPREVAKPNKVAKTAIMSIKSPCHPQILLPSKGEEN
jgi:hypothetical protein